MSTLELYLGLYCGREAAQLSGHLIKNLPTNGSMDLQPLDALTKENFGRGSCGNTRGRSITFLFCKQIMLPSSQFSTVWLRDCYTTLKAAEIKQTKYPVLWVSSTQTGGTIKGHICHCGVACRAVEEIREVTRSRQKRTPLLTELQPFFSSGSSWATSGPVGENTPPLLLYAWSPPEGAEIEERSCSSTSYGFVFFF